MQVFDIRAPEDVVNLYPYTKNIVMTVLYPKGCACCFTSLAIPSTVNFQFLACKCHAKNAIQLMASC